MMRPSYDEFEVRPPKADAPDPIEPTFTLRAQDILAPAIVRAWCEMAVLIGAPPEKVREARAIALAMERWRYRKVPD
jgi:hypothetical protein